MNLKFGWLHRPTGNSLESIGRNVTEYVTIELMAAGIDVQYFYTKEEILNSDLNFYATAGTLWHDELYTILKQDTKQLNVNDSGHVLINGNNLYNFIPLINWGLSHQYIFDDNTENFKDTFEDRGDIFDCCICSAGGSTANLITKNVRLSPDAKIFIVDISKVSLDKCRERLGDNFEFILLDLFDITAVEKFVQNISCNKALWFASNIFNYINTSMIYDTEIRRKKQNDFINILSKQSVDWYVSLHTADAESIKNKSVKELKLLERSLTILPWHS